MTTDDLFPSSQSTPPPLEAARRHLAALHDEMDDLFQNGMNAAAISDLNRRIKEAEIEVFWLETEALK